ncbi:MAG: phage Gp37/Gp68 family protein [Campylobacteraceae bacterium]|jgi:protein gp37|nr:phage Gp37/Gp68 family protein [Campylobacteraceae bacterium]
MALKSHIEWTQSSWNPITGCSKISTGCVNCYAEKMAKRLQSMGNPRYKNGFSVMFHPDVLDEPLKWKKPQIIFVCSMSDIFHDSVSDEHIIKVFEVMNKAERHIFQVLTKRSERLTKLSPKLTWSNNIWMGVTVESQKHTYRIDDLAQIPSKVRFLSIEPLLSDIPNLPLESINWVIVGGESGAGARAVKQEWVRNIRDKCISQAIPFFFKQWGGFNKKAAGKILDGRVWNEMPIAFG